MLVRFQPRAQLNIKISWCALKDSNLGPTRCKRVALPTELRARSNLKCKIRHKLYFALVHRLAYIHNMSNKVPEIEVLYEDDNCLVVSKPAGLMVHSDGRNDGPFLTDWITNKFPNITGVGEPGRTEKGEDINRSGIVHRLDRETSGALIVAKTQEGYLSLKNQFQERTILKKYLAFVWGDIKEDFGTINRPIGRSGNDFRKWSAQRGTRGEIREAETYWTRLWTGISPTFEKDIAGKNVREGIANKFSLLEAEPKTGRTHQIRVHFNAINHPVVGDNLYAPKRPFVLGFDRLALHSRVLEFDSLEGKRIKIQAPLPKDFENAVKDLGIVLK